MTTTETMTDAYWCGVLSANLRVIAKAETLTPESIRRMAQDIIARYDRESGFPPPEAQLRAYVGEDMPLDFLKPGERLINGSVYYSARWLDEGVAEVPGAYRYVIFLNAAKTRMLTCWPQEDENVWKLLSASRAYSDGTWGPPTSEVFHGDAAELELLAFGPFGLSVKELAL